MSTLKIHWPGEGENVWNCVCVYVKCFFYVGRAKSLQGMNINSVISNDVDL